MHDFVCVKLRAHAYEQWQHGSHPTMLWQAACATHEVHEIPIGGCQSNRQGGAHGEETKGATPHHRADSSSSGCPAQQPCSDHSRCQCSHVELCDLQQGTIEKTFERSGLDDHVRILNEPSDGCATNYGHTNVGTESSLMMTVLHTKKK